MKTALITRPQEEAEPLARLLEAKGLRPFIEPLLHIDVQTQNMLLLEAALKHAPQGIIITSKRGIGALAEMTPHRDIPVFCVGAATAEYAGSLGYDHVHHVPTAQSLSELVRSHCTAAQAPLLYARGKDISVDIAAELGQTGFSVDSILVYRAIAAEEFSNDLHGLMSSKNIAGALFFSRRTASIYKKIVEKLDLSRTHTSMHALCISDAVATELHALPWAQIHIAKQPDMPHMLDAAKVAF